MVNAALCLRRPLLITGLPGSGKSTVIDSVAAELGLGEVLRWHITSRSTLAEALYRYDALGRIHANQLKQNDDISLFVRLGPLGTALVPAQHPRALLIDEIDKSDLDLAGDLLDVLEQGEYEIPELARHEQSEIRVRLWKSDDTHTVTDGRVSCTAFPFIVMTSNGERDFAAPFLRRCVRYEMPMPKHELVAQVVRAHLNLDPTTGPAKELVDEFFGRLSRGDTVAVDQLLSAIFLLAGQDAPQGEQRQRLLDLAMRNLSRA
ncbi:AAA family ATPase [Dactylosporangium sp. NPDC049525]|uniref:AAA family ATPase n=1 Tax=Dactylosporangium sp. NPDC049525 TaxID=3154730 RepID=UPI0034220D18